MSLFVTTYLGFLALKFTAKPNIKISIADNNSPEKWLAGDTVDIGFHLESIGHWYSQPDSTQNKVFVNFPKVFHLLSIKYGSDLGKENNIVWGGKEDSTCISAEGIALFYGEIGEDIVVKTTLPTEPSTYDMRVVAHSQQGDNGVQRFQIKVLPKNITRV